MIALKAGWRLEVGALLVLLKPRMVGSSHADIPAMEELVRFLRCFLAETYSSRAGVIITLPGDPLRFAGHGRFDVPGCGDWEGVGAGGQGGVETGGGGGGGECLHAVHTVGLPVLPGGFLWLEVVPAEPGVAGTTVGRRETLSWRWRGLLTLPAPPLPGAGQARALTGWGDWRGQGRSYTAPRHSQAAGRQQVVPRQAGVVLIIFNIHYLIFYILLIVN